MACSIFIDMKEGDIDSVPLSRKASCMFLDALLYPLMSVICSVVFAVLLLVKLLFLVIVSGIKSIPECVNREGLSDFWGCLLLVPVLGTIIHGCVIANKIGEESSFQETSSKLVVFMQAPFMQIRKTAKYWS
ncbi:hypothetical protein C10C_0213 [Chlamydia serpentis]|uniref:Uncharacterized protein n=1 Tax=Chlamydia serpentis TaxID=1967782 RepID=A0A2R8FAK8_9CHLA|nr:hypothetical protein [Chlamydia serpentis]SPN73391.1 hypothetical protein C10C_0213 [Chlamydia serpentis]